MPTSNKVVLNYFEASIADLLGNTRFAESMRHGNENRGQKKATGAADDLFGARGEVAAARGLGMIRDGWLYPTFFVNNGRDPDFGRRIQIRAAADGEIPFRPGDKENELFVLVSYAVSVQDGPIFSVDGWLYGHEILKVGERKDKGNRNFPAYFVGKDVLHDIREIPPEEFSEVKYPAIPPGTLLTPGLFIHILPGRTR